MVEQLLAAAHAIRIARPSIIIHGAQIFAARHVMFVVVMIPRRKWRRRRNLPSHRRHSSIAARTRRVVFGELIRYQNLIILAQRVSASAFGVALSAIRLTSASLATIETRRRIGGRPRRFHRCRRFWLVNLTLRRLR